MPTPTFVGAGAFTAGTGALTVPWPTGIQDGDWGLLVVNSAFKVYTPIGMQTHLAIVGTGPNDLAGGVSLEVEYGTTFASQSGLTSTISDTGSYTTAQIFVFRGWGGVVLGSTSVDATATTTITAPGSVGSVAAGSLAIQLIGLDQDATGTGSIDGALSSSELSSLTKIADATSGFGVGGGIAVITGVVTATGTVGNTTSSASAASTTHAYRTIFLTPGTQPEAHFTASLTSVSSVTAGLTAQVKLAAASASLSTVTGVLNTVIPFPDASNGVVSVSTASADLTIDPFLYIGTPQSQSVASGTLGSVIPLAASSGVSMGFTSRGAWEPAPGANYLNTKPAAVAGRLILDDTSLLWAGDNVRTIAGSISSSLVAVEHGEVLPIFVAYSGADIYSSTDGTTWTLRHSHSVTIFNILYVNGEFVAFSDTSSAAARSSDGLSWTAFTLATHYAAGAKWIGYVNGAYFKQEYDTGFGSYYLMHDSSLTGAWSNYVLIGNMPVQDMWYNGSAWIVYLYSPGFGNTTVAGSNTLISGWGAASTNIPPHISKPPFLRANGGLVAGAQVVAGVEEGLYWTTDGANWTRLDGKTKLSCSYVRPGPNKTVLITGARLPLVSSNLWVEEVSVGAGSSAYGRLTSVDPGLHANATTESSASAPMTLLIRFQAAVASLSSAVASLPAVHQLVAGAASVAAALAVLLAQGIARLRSAAGAKAASLADLTIHAAQHFEATAPASNSVAGASLTAYAIPALAAGSATASSGAGSLRTAIPLVSAGSGASAAQAALQTASLLSAGGVTFSASVAGLSTGITLSGIADCAGSAALAPTRNTLAGVHVRSAAVGAVAKPRQDNMYVRMNP